MWRSRATGPSSSSIAYTSPCTGFSSLFLSRWPSRRAISRYALPEAVSEIAHSLFLSRPRAASRRSTESGKHLTRPSRQTCQHCPPSKRESRSFHHSYLASYPSSSAYQSKANARVPCRAFYGRSRRVGARSEVRLVRPRRLLPLKVSKLGFRAEPG